MILTQSKFKAVVDTRLRNFYFNLCLLGMHEEFFFFFFFGLNSRILFSHTSGGLRSKTKVSAGLLSSFFFFFFFKF